MHQDLFHSLRSPLLTGLSLALATTVPSMGAREDGALKRRDFAPRIPKTSSAPLFSPVSPEVSGIKVENNYADPEMWGRRYQELTYGAIGSGIAVGDFDNDGLTDVFIASKTELSRLFRNLGNWKFEDVTEKAGLAGPSGLIDRGAAWVGSWFGKSNAPYDAPEKWRQGAAFVDINNDGWLDLYVCRFAAPNLLFVNQGDGTFKEEAEQRGLGVTDASGMAAFADYDRDGWLDVYLLTNMLDAASAPNGQRDLLFRNRGDGTFVDVTDKAGIQGEAAGHSVIWWDFDRDGWEDIYVANDFAAPDRLYRNNGDGTFGDVAGRVFPYLPYYAMGCDVADVDGDGLQDLLVADMAATTSEKDQRGMASSRARAQLYPTDSSVPPQYMRNMLFLDTGTGRFVEAARMAGLAASDWTWSTRFEDLDNDGRVDLHITNGMNREYHNVDLLARSMSSDNSDDARKVVQNSPVMAETNLAFRNLGDLQFAPVGREWGLDETGVSFGAAFADFDSDGDLDLVYSNYQKPPTILKNDLAGGNSIRIELRGKRTNRFGLGASVRVETQAGVQVRQVTSSRGYLSGAEPVLHFGLGNVETVNRVVVTWPGGHVQEFTGLSANAHYTLEEAPSPAAGSAAPSQADHGNGARWLQDRSEQLGLVYHSTDTVAKLAAEQAFLPVRLDRLGPTLAVADLNGDGMDDVLVGGSSESPGAVFLGKRLGRFAPALGALPQNQSQVDDGPLAVLDVDLDGDLDVLVTKSGDAPGMSTPSSESRYQPELLLNDGSGRFSPAPREALPAFAHPAGAVATTDADGDGRIDVFIGGRLEPGRYPNSPSSALWLNRGGRFEDATSLLPEPFPRAGMITGAVFADVDQDDRADLILARDWGSVAAFLNPPDGGRWVEASDKLGFSAVGAGLWTTLTTMDVNRDGRPDFVVGNHGLNTHWGAGRPDSAHLFYGSFSGPGSSLLIEARQFDGRLVPARTKSELAAKIPALNRRFPQNDSFAKASLKEILGEERIAKASVWEAEEMQSGVFVSTPGGSYRFAPLPRHVQLAPVQGAVGRDLNGDGNLDLFLTQNSHAPVASIGRFDSGVGVLLTGDGAGSFAVIPATQSGVIVPGDAKGAVGIVIGPKKQFAIVVAVNNGPVKVFTGEQLP